MVYNFNLGIGWASSGVEYAQRYRGIALRKKDIPAKFIFTDMFPRENIEHMTKNLDFPDSEIIWLYTFFTDFETAPVSYTKADLEATFQSQNVTFARNGKVGRYTFAEENVFYAVYFVNETDDLIHRVEIVSNGALIRKDYFTYGRIYSEYYCPENGKAEMYLRRFFNTDGSVAYDEINDHDDVVYRFPHHIVYTKQELVGLLVKELKLTKDDYVLIDRTTGTGQAILENAGDAKVGVVVHADHYSKNSTNEDYVLWNNFYEYSFNMYKHIDFYIVSTEAQKKLLKKQFEKYMGVSPAIIVVPVGSLNKLREPDPAKGRKPYSMMTASRLASEKHVDWDIRACVEAKKQVPELSLDIYGEGGAMGDLQKLINDLGAQDYIRLMGQYDLTDIYQNYELYLSASTSEGFGLSLMEAIGGGLPIVGFDVPYGNPTFVDEGKNGYLLEGDANMDPKLMIARLTEGVVKYFNHTDLEAFHKHSYKKASEYLSEEVMKQWQKLLEK